MCCDRDPSTIRHKETVRIGNIVDDDASQPLVITVSNPTAFENTNSLTFNIHRTSGAMFDHSVYLNYSTSDGTASYMQSDYTSITNGGY